MKGKGGKGGCDQDGPGTEEGVKTREGDRCQLAWAQDCDGRSVGSD